MASTNFDLAPPPKTVDDLLAVPIDIQGITAKLTFDGATESGSGDATLDFIMGPHNGNPIFDLRQTVMSAWLDGTPFPVAQLAPHVVHIKLQLSISSTVNQRCHERIT